MHTIQTIAEALEVFIVDIVNLQNQVNRPNRLRFVLPISSHMNIHLGNLSIVQLFSFMAQLWTARNMLEKSEEVLSRDWSHDLKWM